MVASEAPPPSSLTKRLSEHTVHSRSAPAHPQSNNFLPHHVQDYLVKWPKTLMVVSHARDFLNMVCTDILHLHSRKLTSYKGDFDTFERTATERLRNAKKAAEGQERQRAHMQVCWGSRNEVSASDFGISCLHVVCCQTVCRLCCSSRHSVCQHPHVACNGFFFFAFYLTTLASVSSLKWTCPCVCCWSGWSMARLTPSPVFFTPAT